MALDEQATPHGAVENYREAQKLAALPFTLTQLHTEAPTSEVFRQDLRDFIATCRVVRGLRAEGLQATAIQCWTALEQFYGIVPCTLMSMLSDSLLPSACEVDVTGAVSMNALALASGSPSAIVDWNNNCGVDPDKAVVFHCGNLPRSLFASCSMGYQAIIASTVGQENAYGTVNGRLKATPITFARISTDDAAGCVRTDLGEGELSDDPLDTFGGYAVVHIPHLQALLQQIARSGFEHHVALNQGRWGAAVSEAFSRYLGWDVYYHA